MKKMNATSESSVLGARRARKGFVTSAKLNVRYVEFTPEEMAYDAPPDTSDPTRFPTIGRGPDDWKKFVNFRNGFVRLAPDLQKKFRDDSTVNHALRNWLETQNPSKRRKRKTA
jgi:hypothetical protein